MTFLGAKYEKIIKRDKIYRTLSVFLFLLSAVAVTGMVFMLPSYFTVVLSKDEVLRNLKAAEDVLARRESNKLEEETSKVNKAIADYEKNESKRHSFSGLLVSIFKVTPPEVGIEKINLIKDKTGSFTLNVDGNASTRESLISYIANLQKLTSIAQVKSPISNLLEESNAAFHLELQIKQESYKL